MGTTITEGSITVVYAGGRVTARLTAEQVLTALAALGTVPTRQMLDYEPGPAPPEPAPPAPEPSPPRDAERERQARALRLRRQGRTWAEVGEAMGVSARQATRLGKAEAARLGEADSGRAHRVTDPVDEQAWELRRIGTSWAGIGRILRIGEQEAMEAARREEERRGGAA